MAYLTPWEVAHRLRRDTAKRFFGRDDRIFGIIQNLGPACPTCNRSDNDGKLWERELVKYVFTGRFDYCKKCGRKTLYDDGRVKNCQHCI